MQTVGEGPSCLDSLSLNEPINITIITYDSDIYDIYE
jgi:hypothetical protein